MRTFALPLALLIATAAEARSPRDSLFPGDQGCYLRQYSKAHLADHPDQLVTQIAVGVAKDIRGNNRNIILNVGIHVRGTQDLFYGVAYCVEDGPGLSCLMEGDAGAFTVSGTADGSALLKVARRGMAFEGMRDFFEISGTSGDDRSFLMPKVSTGSCP